MDNLLIEFYSETQGAVRIDWPASMGLVAGSPMRERMDAVIVAIFALRQLRNLGRHPVTDALAYELMRWRPPTYSRHAMIATRVHVLYAVAQEVGLSREDANAKYGQPVYLVSYQGLGKRRFVGRLGMPRPGMLQFFLDVKGFGLGIILGMDINLYAPDSVLLALAHLANEYRDDGNLPIALGNIAAECAHLHFSGKIHPMLLEAQAANIVYRHLPEG